MSSTTKIHAVEQQPLDDEDEVQALSHKTQRKLKKKQKLLESQPSTSSEQSKLKQKKADMTQNDKPKRQHSVWVGNLSFKTKPDALRRFFADAGEITRVHMPTKALHGTKLEGEMRGENRGSVCIVCVERIVLMVCGNFRFAYVDFATPDAKVNAIAMSEKNLDGRRLLIKDGELSTITLTCALSIDIRVQVTTSQAVLSQLMQSKTEARYRNPVDRAQVFQRRHRRSSHDRNSLHVRAYFSETLVSTQLSTASERCSNAMRGVSIDGHKKIRAEERKGRERKRTLRMLIMN